MNETWTLRLRSIFEPDHWTAIFSGRRETLAELLHEVAVSMLSPFRKIVAPGTYPELVSSTGRVVRVKKVWASPTGPSVAVDATFKLAPTDFPEAFHGTLAPAPGSVPQWGDFPDVSELTKGTKQQTTDPFEGLRLPPFPGIDAAGLN